MSMPMPAHERFYKGTLWTVAAGPIEWVGHRVKVTGEVFERDNELWVPVVTLVLEKEFEACLSWLS